MKKAKPPVVPGHVKLTFTLDMPRELAERRVQAIRERRNIEALIIEMFSGGTKPMTGTAWPKDQHALTYNDLTGSLANAATRHAGALSATGR